MKNQKRIYTYFICLAVLVFGFILCRYILFSVHGMREWPGLLFAAGIAVLTVSFFAKAKVVPVLTAATYLVSFFLGALLQTNGTDPGGGTTNNLWIIWTVSFIGMIFVSVLAELFTKKKK